MSDPHAAIRSFLADRRDDAVRLLAELVRTPSDNPPGDCAALRGSVELHFTYDEEVGGAIGPPWLLERGITKPDYAISAGFAYAITIAHNGCLHLEVEVRGKSGHAALPEEGIDALEAATGI